MSLIKKISKRPLEEEHYELPTIMETYIKNMNDLITKFEESDKNITDISATEYLCNLNNLSEQYKRFAEDYHRYKKDKFYKNHTIMKEILEYKKKLQNEFIKLYNRFKNVKEKSKIGLDFILNRMYKSLDLQNELWNKSDKESIKIYVASDPTLGKK